MSEEKISAADRIVQKIRIPVEYCEVEVDTSRDEISKLISRLILDDDFRVQFNKSPDKIFQDVGIHIDERTIKKIEDSPITSFVKDLSPQPYGVSIAIVIIGVIVGVIAPPKPAEGATKPKPKEDEG